MTQIRMIDRQGIDVQKWDELIRRSPNGLIYGTTAVLDHFAPGWMGLVHGDYEAVMPLTWRKKATISYLFQPPFLQQLGVFGAVTYQPEFLREARLRFRFAEICLNFSNEEPDAEPRKNYVLSLQEAYPAIGERYESVHRKNLKRAANSGLRYSLPNDTISAMEQSILLYGKRQGWPRRKAVEQLAVFAAEYPELVIAREAWHNEELQATCLCFRDHRRIYFILSSVTEGGRKNQANHYLVDNLIREFAGTGLILDFEGSDMPGVASFYRGFGATDQAYFFCRWNHLPWPMNWLKDRRRKVLLSKKEI